MARFDARPLEDFAMWAMLQKGGQRADISQLKKFVDQWVQMTTQKTAGQRGARIYRGITWNASKWAFCAKRWR